MDYVKWKTVFYFKNLGIEGELLKQNILYLIRIIDYDESFGIENFAFSLAKLSIFRNVTKQKNCFLISNF